MSSKKSAAIVDFITAKLLIDMYSILKKELKTFFSNATGYIVIALFLLLTGLLIWVIPGQYNVLDSGYANLDGLFYLAPWLFLFLCPAITMRLFAEEKQAKTWELLKTRPIKKTSIVLGKFTAAWILVCMALLPTLVYYFSVYLLAEPMGNIDSGSFWGSFIGLFFLSAVYCSIGTFASSLSSNQITSFIIALVLCFFFYFGFELIANFTPPKTSILIESLGISSHYKSMSRGVLDSRDIAYFLFISFIFIAATSLKIRK